MNELSSSLHQPQSPPHCSWKAWKVAQGTQVAGRLPKSARLGLIPGIRSAEECHVDKMDFFLFTISSQQGHNKSPSPFLVSAVKRETYCSPA